MRLRSATRKEWKVALQFQGATRECFLLVENKGNFHIILSLASKWLHHHVSYHATGQRHFKVGPKGRKPGKCFVSLCQRTSSLRGVELLLGASILWGQFQDLRLCNPSHVPAVVLDADAAHFRDDIIFVRVFLFEPNREPSIPAASNVGPQLLHVIQDTHPWVGIAFFQQKAD